MNYALITGASGGIGEALANQFAKDGIPLILIARNTEKLERVKADLASEHQVEVVIRSADLSKAGAAQELHDWTTSKELTVDYLVNNAGFGDRANVIDAKIERLDDMIHLNIDSLVGLSKLYAADMATRKRGNIVNIASIASFVPGPGMAVYFASKAFVLSFSQALAAELEASNVVVTAICPGPTETGFASNAGAENAPMFKKKLPNSEQVAVFAYKAMKKGSLVAVWGIGNKLMARFVGLAPRRQVARSVRKMQE